MIASSAGPPVVVLGTGVTALGTLRILGRDRLAAIVAESNDPLLRRSRWYRPAPAGTRSLETGQLASWLASLTVERAVVLPCSDHWVSEVADLPPALRERFPASVPQADTLARFVDKGRFAELLREAGTPHPFSRPLSSAGDLDDVPAGVFDQAILKPRDSQSFMQRFGTKAVHVSSRDDAIEALGRVHGAGHAVILQEYIPGPANEHYFVDGFIDAGGTVRAIFVRRRLRMHPADFGNSTAMVSVEAGAAREAVESITSLLTGVGYRGIFSAEFKRDPRDGVFKILEVNARPWWFVDFAARCGVDVCRMAYDDALDRAVPPVQRYDVGRRLVFPYYDYFACRSLRGEGRLSAWAWLRSWAGAMQPVFQLEDPVPGTMAFMAAMTRFTRNRLARMLPGRGLARSPRS